MKRLIKYFIQGLIISTPIAITIYLFIQVFKILDSFNPFHIPGAGLVLTLIVITAVGFIVSHFISDKLRTWFDNFIKKAPIVNLVYTAVQDLMKSFVGEKQGFKKPVVVQLSENSEIRRLGFITDEGLELLESEGDPLVSVYIPHSYNISGNLFLVPRKYIQSIDVNPSDLMKYTLSAGLSTLEKKEKGEIARHEESLPSD